MKGATVIIADTHSAPVTTVHPGLFFSQSGQESEPIAGGQFDWNPDKSPSGPVSLIVSSADKTVYVYRNGVEIGRAGIPNAQVVSPLNDRVFSALQGTDAQGHVRWIEVTAAGTEGASESLFLTAQKSGLPSDSLRKQRQSLHRERQSFSPIGRWIQPRKALPTSKLSLRKKTRSSEERLKPHDYHRSAFV